MVSTCICKDNPILIYSEYDEEWKHVYSILNEYMIRLFTYVKFWYTEKIRGKIRNFKHYGILQINICKLWGRDIWKNKW